MVYNYFNCKIKTGKGLQEQRRSTRYWQSKPKRQRKGVLVLLTCCAPQSQPLAFLLCQRCKCRTVDLETDTKVRLELEARLLLVFFFFPLPNLVVNPSPRMPVNLFTRRLLLNKHKPRQVSKKASLPANSTTNGLQPTMSKTALIFAVCGAPRVQILHFHIVLKLGQLPAWPSCLAI